MDKKPVPEAPYSAELHMPKGGAYRGKLAVRGLHALWFQPEEAIREDWRGVDNARLTLFQPGGPGSADAQLTVACNGLLANGLDLTVTGGLTDDSARVLGMQLKGQRASQRIAADYLAEFNAHGIALLGDSLRAFTMSLGDHLFDLSTSPRHGISGRHEHYEALNALKRANKSFVSGFLNALEEELGQPEKPRGKRSGDALEDTDASELNLVELTEMEEKLALDRITTDAVNLYRVDLESLTLRAGDLLSLGASRVKTPFHPAYLCRAFRDGLHALGVSPTVMQDSLKFFHREWIRKLRGFYARLNSQLASDGLRPGLEDTLMAAGSIMDASARQPARQRRREDTAQTADESDSSEDSAAGAGQRSADSGDSDSPGDRRRRGGRRATDLEAEAAPAPRMKHDAMYDAVVNALSMRNVEREAEREAEGGAVTADAAEEAAGGTPPTAARIEPAAVVQALLQLQQHPEWLAAGDGGQPLRELLEQHAAQLPALGGGRLQVESANRLDFVDNVFSTIRGSVDVADDVKPTLDQLRIPLARLSLEEPRFFADPQHPAHKVLDRLSQLATAENFPNRVLENKVNTIVGEIASTYDGDRAVFEKALQSLERLVRQQETALRKNIDRVVSTLQGQDRLQQAKQSVDGLVAHFIRPPSAPRVLLDLMDAGWRDLLVQIAVREGTGSQAWQDQVTALEKILNALQRIESGEATDTQARDLAPTLGALKTDIEAAQPDNLGHTSALGELAQILRGEVPLETAAVADQRAGEDRVPAERLEALPRLQRWIKRVEQLEPGTVMSYRDRAGYRRRMRLVWASEDKQRFAFVNELGQKVAELSKVQLARKLSQGLKPPTPVETMSVLNQSVYGTLVGAQERLSFKRNRDQVTRLINGDSLFRQVERSVRHAQRHDVAHAFLHLDIDSFHLVNEVYDEVDGDAVLAEFARLLGQLNEKRSLTARLESDSFGILLAYRDLDEAMRFANRIRHDIAESSVTVSGEEVSFTTSIGVAPILQSTADAGTVLQQAADAVSTAKERGGNSCVAWDVDQQQLTAYQREKAASQRQLEDAIATDSLVLRAQPIVQSAMDGSRPASHHYEILLSIRQEDGSLLSPAEFIRSAERFGFITLVDRWVVRRVCEWISGLMDQQKVVPQLSINLSGPSLTDDAFMDYVLEQISEFGVGTSKICFEITETGAIENLTKAGDFVRTLRNIGCKFSLDDFGTGLSSYSYLRDLPVDYVKIDGTFITDIDTNETDMAMTRSINDLAHFLGQETIAECVETLDIVEHLREVGIDYLQGWGIGMPRELAEVTRELEALET
jgi:diguanylate cyclase (GGDEF)-like protein